MSQAEQIKYIGIIQRLDEIDRASARPAREISHAVATGQPAPDGAAQKLASLETEAASLRAELALLGNVWQ